MSNEEIDVDSHEIQETEEEEIEDAKQNFSVELEEEDDENKPNSTEMKLSEDENQNEEDKYDEEEEISTKQKRHPINYDEEESTFEIIAKEVYDNQGHNYSSNEEEAQENTANLQKAKQNEQNNVQHKPKNIKPIQENDVEIEMENVDDISENQNNKNKLNSTRKQKSLKSELDYNRTSRTIKDKFKPMLSGPKQLTISMPKERLVRFPNVKDDKKSIVRVIDLTHNRLVNFVGMNNLPHLTSLTLDDNCIRSFKGADYCKSLQWVSMQKCPISKNSNFKLMVLVVFDNIQEHVDYRGNKSYTGSILSINNSQISNKLREQAFKLAPTLRPLLLEGKVISSLKPLRLVDNETDNEEDKVVEPNEELFETATRLTTILPSIADKILTRTRLLSQMREKPKPSIAVICNEVVASEDMSVFVPDSIVRDIATRLSDLRKQYEQPAATEEEEEDASEVQNKSHESMENDDNNVSNTENEEDEDVAEDVAEEESGVPSSELMKRSDV